MDDSTKAEIVAAQHHHAIVYERWMNARSLSVSIRAQLAGAQRRLNEVFDRQIAADRALVTAKQDLDDARHALNLFGDDVAKLSLDRALETKI